MSYLCVYIYIYTHGTEKEKVSEREQEGGEEKRRSLRAFGKLRAPVTWLETGEICKCGQGGGAVKSQAIYPI